MGQTPGIVYSIFGSLARMGYRMNAAVRLCDRFQVAVTGKGDLTLCRVIMAG